MRPAANSRQPADPGARRAGLAMMAMAMLLVPGLDVFAKLLMVRLTPLEVTAGRFVAQSIVLFPFVLLFGARLRPRRLDAVGGICLAFALLAFNGAIRTMPIANALAIFFVEPLILTVLAWLVLNERLDRRSLVEIAFGLAGALIVLRPNVAAFGIHALYPLATAVLLALYMLTLRRSAAPGGALSLQFWNGVFAALTLCAVLVAAEGWPVSHGGPGTISGGDILLLLLLGLLAGIAHQFIARSLSLVEAGTAAPLQYLELVGAIVLGWLVFDNLPDPMTWLGSAIIISSGCLLLPRGTPAGTGAI